MRMSYFSQFWFYFSNLILKHIIIQNIHLIEQLFKCLFYGFFSIQGWLCNICASNIRSKCCSVTLLPRIKALKQYPAKQQLYGHRPPISKTIQIRRARPTGNCWKSKDELISDVLLWTLHMAQLGLGNQLGPIYNSSVLILDGTRKTFLERWTIETSRERASRKSVQVTRHDDDDDDLV